MNLFILLKSVMKCFTGRPWSDIDGHYWVPIAWSVHGRTICYNHDKIEGIRTKLGRKRVELTSSKFWILPQQCPMDTWKVSGSGYTPIQRAFRIWPPTPMQHLYQLLFIKIHLVCNILYMLYASNKDSGVANWYGGMGGRVPPWQPKKLRKSGKEGGNRRKEGGNQEKSGKRGKIVEKGQNREGFFHFALLTDRAGYATEQEPSISGNLRLYWLKGLGLCDFSISSWTWQK